MISIASQSASGKRMGMWKLIPIVPNKEDMKDNTHTAFPKQDYAQRIENQRKLAEYIKTSLWDEMMNQRREHWLWERKGVTPFINEHYR